MMGRCAPLGGQEGSLERGRIQRVRFRTGGSQLRRRDGELAEAAKELEETVKNGCFVARRMSMNFFGRDLKLDHTGDDVRQVQDQLAQLGVAIPDAERSSGKFGPATHAAIMNLQGENGLPLTGVVDSATADL